ncbi:MAG: hypothetical protein RMJ59_04575 [Candidatus Nitrosocaldus sp.]|nr:hypothetical protein [Candidatus Nitrosocaldus sp.]MDW8275640.1 hypothetical protein [Candidatus Nitrosocaldus sp.]
MIEAVYAIAVFMIGMFGTYTLLDIVSRRVKGAEKAEEEKERVTSVATTAVGQ